MKLTKAGRIRLQEWIRKSWTSTKLKRAREGPLKVEVIPWNGGECAETRNIKIRKWRQECWARIFSLFREYNLQRLQSKQEESTEEEEMMQQQRMMIMKGLTKKMRSKGRMDTESRWRVSELLAADCEKAWIHTGWEDTLQKWCECWRK